MAGVWRCLFISLVLTGSALALEPWTRRDTLWESGYLVAHCMDWLQTLETTKPARIRVEPDGTVVKEWQEELNPILGPNPSRGKVNRYFLITGLVHVGVVRVLPARYRRPFQGATLALEVGCIAHNYRAGVRIRF